MPIILPDAVVGAVVTRFPPEPSWVLDLGHCKASLMNQYIATQFKVKYVANAHKTDTKVVEGDKGHGQADTGQKEASAALQQRCKDCTVVIPGSFQAQYSMLQKDHVTLYALLCAAGLFDLPSRASEQDCVAQHTSHKHDMFPRHVAVVCHCCWLPLLLPTVTVFTAQGRWILRFDDTNPKTCSRENVAAYLRVRSSSRRGGGWMNHTVQLSLKTCL
jgi:hypothetical protein